MPYNDPYKSQSSSLKIGGVQAIRPMVWRWDGVSPTECKQLILGPQHLDAVKQCAANFMICAV